MACPWVAFTLIDGDRPRLKALSMQGDMLESRLARLAEIMGRDFAENALPIEAEREGLRLTGYAGVPTLNRANTRLPYLFVHSRPGKDRLLTGPVRGANAELRSASSRRRGVPYGGESGG